MMSDCSKQVWNFIRMNFPEGKDKELLLPEL